MRTWLRIGPRSKPVTPGAYHRGWRSSSAKSSSLRAQSVIYHAVSQQDYIAIVAALPDSRLPIVRQYRPALESFTWELPAGLIDPGDDAVACCRRELMEETGFAARIVHALGCYAPCTSRLSNRVHSFYVEVDPSAEGKPTEPEIEIKLVSLAQLAQLILA